MIIIIDEASEKLASFYYHDEIFKLQWKRADDMSSASDELHDEFQENCMTSSNMNYRKNYKKNYLMSCGKNCMLRYWQMNQLMTSKKQRYKNLQITPQKLIREI